ncbi:hypothetical protein NRB56_31010 [Nocardia sp. RB56]|uniref:HTH luxR-type domain-containing protein n=1 Tax=Nocardia aurantia TaxID=2585199 RepID=A0A7K0DPJ4_9NOCA|nr:hypothetical protein [Nocardia aurantia]
MIIELFASGLLAADISAILKITGPELTAEIRSIIKKYRNADSKIPQLSPKEREVFRLYAYGQGAKGIAQSLGITNNTVWTHIKKVKYKYERVGRPCNTRSEMRQNAIADGIIPEP